MTEPTVLSFLVTVDATGDPKLYADLVRFRKGKPRVQRMRVLALQGLLSEGGVPMPGGTTEQAGGGDGCGVRGAR